MNESPNAAKTVGSSTTLLGVAAIILGMLAMVAPVLTGFSVVLFLGLLVLTAGILRIVWAFQAGSLGESVLLFVVGGLTALCGVALLVNPLFASGVLTIVLAAYFIFDGIFEIGAATRMGQKTGRGWMLFGGVVSILLGIMIWSQFPLSGVWAIGILLGIKLFLAGLVMVMGGTAMRATAYWLRRRPS